MTPSQQRMGKKEWTKNLVKFSKIHKSIDYIQIVCKNNCFNLTTIKENETYNYLVFKPYWCLRNLLIFWKQWKGINDEIKILKKEPFHEIT